MTFELILLGALIFIFIVSFCGLLQKVKQTYERERVLAEEISRRRNNRSGQRNSCESFAEIYVNPSFGDEEEGNNRDSTGVFPAAPPPYTSQYCDPPPKYEDIIKNEVTGDITIREHPRTQPTTQSTQRSSSPPPYTISISIP